MHCWEPFLLLVFIKMRQISQVSLLLMPAPAAAPYANMVPTKRGHTACSLPALCASLSGFTGTPHQIIPKGTRASILDACQSTKCCTGGYRSVVFFAQERNIHLDRVALTEEARVCISCSSAWKLLLVSSITRHTSHHLLIYFNVKTETEGSGSAEKTPFSYIP